jgi:hypothetical protein
MNSLQNRMEKNEKSFTSCRRKTELSLVFHFAVKNDDEELNPTLSRLEVLAIPICLCIPFDSCI